MAEPLTALQYYPWQKDVAEHWLSHQERFAHAWLIHGLAGIGKVQFARAGAAALLCEQPLRHIACGHCASCQWVLSGNHPDLRFIRPDAITAEQDPESLAGTSTTKTPSKHIRVEQLRELSTWFNTASHRGGYKVAVLYPAESLNAISANALLKVLEEPNEKTVFLVVADHYERLLPTIISRCRRLPLATPTKEQSVAWLDGQIAQPEQWLAAVGGAPVAALKASHTHHKPYPDWLDQLCQYLAQGRHKAIIALAPQLEAVDPSIWIETLQRLHVDIQLCMQNSSVRYYPHLQPSLESIAARMSALAVQQQWKWLVTQKRHAEHPLNAKLLVHTALERIAQSLRAS